MARAEQQVFSRGARSTPGQVRAGYDRSRQVPRRRARGQTLCVAQVGTIEGSAVQLGSGQIESGEISVTQVGTSQIGPIEIRPGGMP